MKELFPDCRILTERVLGAIPKSYIAVAHPTKTMHARRRLVPFPRPPATPRDSLQPASNVLLRPLPSAALPSAVLRPVETRREISPHSKRSGPHTSRVAALRCR